MKGLDDFQAFRDLLAQGRRNRGLHLFMALAPQGLDIDLSQQFTNRFRPDADVKGLWSILVHTFTVFLFREQFFFLQRGFQGIKDDVRLKIENFLQLLEAHVQQDSDPARHPF